VIEAAFLDLPPLACALLFLGQHAISLLGNGADKLGPDSDERGDMKVGDGSVT
jgi:hypothetical protein